MQKLLVAISAVIVTLAFSTSAMAGNDGKPQPASRWLDSKAPNSLSTPKIPSSVLDISASKK